MPDDQWPTPYQQGAEAARLGKPVGANPHGPYVPWGKMGLAWHQWNAGHRDEMEKINKEKFHA